MLTLTRLAMPLLFLTLVALPASAANPDFLVNDPGDSGDGTCDAIECTLREAASAVTAGLGRSIGFDPAVFPPGNPTTILDTTILDSAAGIRVDSVGDISGLKILANTSRFQEAEGIAVESTSGSIVNASISDNRIGVSEGIGIEVTADGDIAKLTLSRNTASRNSVGISIAASDISKARVEKNRETAGSQSGLFMESDSASKLKIAENHVSGGALDGLALLLGFATKVQITNNQATMNDGIGIGVEVGPKNKIQGNESSANGSSGFIIRATQSQIVKNVASGCQDGFLFGFPSSQLKVTQNRAIGNAGVGLAALSVTNSSFQKNYVRGGFDVDFKDSTADCGSNVWKNNDFLWGDPFDCIQ